MLSRTILTAQNAPANVHGAPEPSTPVSMSCTANIGDGTPNVFNSLVHRARALLNNSGPITDRLPPPRSASAPATLLMATDELGSPTIVGAVSGYIYFF